MVLTGQQKKQLREAIVKAFTKEKLEMLLDEDLEIEVSSIPQGEDYNGFVFNTIQYIGSIGRIEAFIQFAREINPDNELLKEAEKEILGREIASDNILTVNNIKPPSTQDDIEEDTSTRQPSKTLQSFLSILIEPILQPKDKNKFTLKAIFIEDSAPFKGVEETILSEPIEKFDIKNKSIIKKINDCINQCRNKLYGKRFELTIEFFLPYKYLALEIEKIPFSRKEYLGESYNLILRSYERFCSADSLNYLMAKWEILDNFNDTEAWKQQFKITDEVRDKKWKALKNKLLEDNQLVLRICSDFPALPKHKESLFAAISEAGIPICIWNRCCEVSYLDIEPLFDDILSLENAKNLSKLGNAILKLRRKAYEDPERTTQCLGYHLGYLYDDPQRIPECLKTNNRLLSGAGE